MFKIVLFGQKQQGADWFVKAGDVLVSECVCVCESLFVYTPASI